ncbi:MAG TPA: hypothetical protein VER36_06075 [Flavisolibacter sp.]|nr:hypothetical protein [Flavisolibacter sp.]
MLFLLPKRENGGQKAKDADFGFYVKVVPAFFIADKNERSWDTESILSSSDPVLWFFSVICSIELQNVEECDARDD